jgi:mRNA interferase MazF
MATRARPKRGEIWLVEFEPAIGAEIRKLRPAVELNVAGVGRLPLKIVVPLTEWKPAYAGFTWIVRVPSSASTGLIKDSGADAFQVKSVSDLRFDRKIGDTSPQQLQRIASAVAMCVGAP